MKITFLLLLASLMTVSASTIAQKVTLDTKGAKLESVLQQIKKQTGYDFVADETLLENAKTVTLHLKNADIDQALKELFENQQLTYTLEDKVVTIKEKPPGLLDKIKNYFAAIDVTGRILDENNQPLSGATIQTKDSKISTLSDANGFFTLKQVQAGTIIVVTFIGYQKQELAAVPNLGVIKLAPANNPLDEVHVIAYGTTSQRLSVGNITKVSGEQINDQPVGNPLQTLEGRVPGLFITQANGMAGSGMTVRIQGQNSISSGNDPLYVIDGVPYVSQMLPTTNVGPQGLSGGINSGNSNPMSFINTLDIESIEVLKDADATAIYGSRAANGAILITTKKGKAGKDKISLNLQNGWGKVGEMLPVLNTSQYLQMRHEALKNDGLNPYPSKLDPNNFDFDINGLWDTTRNTNWQKVLLGGTSHYTNVNGSVSGGNATTQYFIGGTYHRETSVFPGDFDDVKGGVHFNLTTESANQKFKIQLTGSYLADNNQLPTSDITSTAIKLAPDAPALYNPNGSLNWQIDPQYSFATWQNPLGFLKNIYNSKTNNITGSGLLSYLIIPGLQFSSNLGYTNLQTNEFAGFSALSYDPATQLRFGSGARSANYSYNTINSWSIEPQLNYNLQIKKNKLSLLVGGTLQQRNSDGTDLHGSSYTSDALLSDIRSAANTTVGGSYYAVYKYSALFGRANYNWADKYLLDLNIRRDGSSRFGPQSQFHNFWSVGAGWIFSEERVIKDNIPFLSFGKLHGSYGTTGNDQISDYQFLNLYTAIPFVGVPYQGSTGFVASGIPNPYLQWEETRKLQLGIDLGFFSDRILFSATYVHNRSSNELINSPLPISDGFGVITINLPAVVQNTETELSLRTANIESKNFSWTTYINFTIPENKLISYSGTLPSYLYLGKPLNINPLYRFDGVNPTTGAYQFLDKMEMPLLTLYTPTMLQL